MDNFTKKFRGRGRKTKYILLLTNLYGHREAALGTNTQILRSIFSDSKILLNPHPSISHSSQPPFVPKQLLVPGIPTPRFPCGIF